MSYRIYVGNLPWRIDDDQLRQLFGQHGPVIDARVVMDRETGRSRGFGFFTMDPPATGVAAVRALSGAPIEGRPLVVNEARERVEMVRRSPFGQRRTVEH